MRISDYVKEHRDTYPELHRFFNNVQARNILDLDSSELDKRKANTKFREALHSYANGPKGPYGNKRLQLHQETHILFEDMKRKGLCSKTYDLKNSFISDEEANIIMLKAAHERVSTEALSEILACTPNAIGDRRRHFANGVRIGGTCVQTEFGYRGSYESSVHPITMPLNLSELYVLLQALKSFEAANDRTPHAAIAERLGDLVHSQLSDYAKNKLDARMEEMGYSFYDDYKPQYAGDTASDFDEHIMYMKMGTIVAVDHSDKTDIGRIRPTMRNTTNDTKPSASSRSLLTLQKENGEEILIEWKNVLNIRPV